MSLVISIVVLLLVAAAFSYFIFLTRKNAHKIREEMDKMASRVNAYLDQTLHLTQKSGEGTVKVISDLYTRLGALEESSHKIYEVGKEIGKLQEVLRAPKARGGLGELMLADLLSQMIPQDHFELQHQFRNGTR